MFLYFASLAPHAPYQAPKEDIAAYEGVFKEEKRRTYAAMITALDEQIGRVVEALDRKGMRENTLILFASDNSGPVSALFATGARSPEERESSGGVALGDKPPVSNGAFRGGKGSLYEGGVRVAAFANWPGTLKPAVVNEPVHMVDIMPTLLALAAAKGSPDHPFDGMNIWKVMNEGKPSPHEDILINVEAFRGAIRKGQWKLIKIALLPGKVELFDLSKDAGETTNVADQHPEIVKDLESRLVAYAKQQKPSEWIKAQPAFLGAQGKTVLDPDFDIDDSGLPREKPAMAK
jgi:arylsulfatase A-like enzyme